MQVFFLPLHPRERAIASGRFDATDAGRDAAFADYLEEADVASTFDVGATAQLARRTDVKHTNLVAVFLTEQRHRAALDRVVVFHDARGSCLVLGYFRVNDH